MFGVKSPIYRSSQVSYRPLSCQELYLQYWEDEILYHSIPPPPPSPPQQTIWPHVLLTEGDASSLLD